MPGSYAEGHLESAWDVVLQTLGGPPNRDLGHGPEPQASSLPGSPENRLSVTVLTGFLGAGKTTLLCRLLEQSALQITAIVNDVASINVDAALIRSRSAETIEFQNGCACCALQADLYETLEEISARKTVPDAVLIEASGIADPLGIAQAVANVPGATLDGIVTLVDATSFRSSASDPATASVFARQVAAAHLVVLTKTDHRSDLETLTRALGRLAPGRPVLACADLFLDGGEAACEILLGAAVRGARPTPATSRSSHPVFAVDTRAWSRPLSASAFFELLDRLPESLYRMKGSVWLQARAEESARCVDVQVVGPRWRVTESETKPADSHLVLIGRSGADSLTEFAAALGTL